MESRPELAVIFPYVHVSNAQRMLDCMPVCQRVAACLHGAVNVARFDDGDVARSVARLRSGIALIRSIVGNDAAATPTQKSLFPISFMYGGKPCRVMATRQVKPDVLELVCECGVLLTAWVCGVDRRLIAASAFAHFQLYQSAFESVVAGDCDACDGASVCACCRGGAGFTSAALILPSHSKTVDCPQSPRDTASAASVFTQSLILTVLQVVTGQLVDRSSAKCIVDSRGRMLYYHAPLLPVGTNAGATASARHPALDAQTVSVRASCVAMFRGNPEYVHWISFILTGIHHCITPLPDDCPLVFVA